MTEQPPPEGTVQIPVIWVGGDDLPTISVNQFLVQVDGDEIILSLGTLTPPVLLADSPESAEEQAAKVGYVPIRMVARLSLAPRRLRELSGLLQRGIEMNERGVKVT